MSPLEATRRPQTTEASLLTQGATEFLNALHRCFGLRREEILGERLRRQQQMDAGEFPASSRGKGSSSSKEWKIQAPPEDLEWRTVMITAAPTMKSLLGGLESKAKTVVADLDDRLPHTWTNCLAAHAALCDLIQRTKPELSKQLSRRRPALIVRPRNLNLDERHFFVQKKAIAASLFDFGLYAYHWAEAAPANGLYVSLPKLESAREARLWNDLFVYTENSLDLKRGTIRAVVTIETVAAAFEMEAILFELREHAWALECAPANYLASFAKTFRAHGHSLLPQRADITMNQPFLRAYQELLVHTSHAHGARAWNAGLSQLPAHEDWSKNPWARASVRESANHELEMGFDGFSVAHRAFLPMVLSAYKEGGRKILPRDERCYITPSDLIGRACGQVTMAGLQENIAFALDYLEAWLAARETAPGEDRGESMATAELCRAQLWQWVHHSVRLGSGGRVNSSLLECLVRDRLAATESRMGAVEFAASKFANAAELLLHTCMDSFDSLLAVKAYSQLAS